MEIAGLAVGVIGLAGLLSVYQDVIEQINTYKNLGPEYRSSEARFKLSKKIFESWADDVGISGSKIGESHHPKLDDPAVASVVNRALLSIYEIFHVTRNTSLAPRLELADNHLLSAASGLEALPKKSRHKSSLQVLSKRDKVRWMLGGRINFGKQLDAFGDLVEKLCSLVPPQRTDFRPNELDKSKHREESHEYQDILRVLKDIADHNEEETREKTRTWLGAVTTEEQYNKLCRTRLSGTCDWIFHDLRYMQWASLDFRLGKPKLLWINAPAGFGKSFLCANITQSMMKTATSPVVYFFCSSDVETQREPIVIIRSWILQLIRLSQEAFIIVQEKIYADEASLASTYNIWELFRSILRVIPNSTLILDGLDECTQIDPNWRTAEENMRHAFLEELKLSVEETTTRILVVSRDEVDIRSGISPNVENAAAQTIYECRLSKDDVQSDVTLFSRSIVDRRLSNKVAALREEIATQIAEKCNGMFLWVQLQAKHLHKSENRKQLYKAIEDMPAGLEHVYDRDWRNILNLKRDKSRALAILRWVTFAQRPLTVVELTEALIITDHGYGCDDLRLDEWPDNIDKDYIDEQIIGLCGSLLEVKSTDPNQPLESRTVQLVHFSVKEFLLCVLPEIDDSTIDGVAFSDQVSQNNHLAKICLWYLGYEKSWLSSSSSGCDQKCRPFLDYAVRSWYLHVFSENELDHELSHIINKFFRPENKYWQLWRTHFERNPQTMTETEGEHGAATSLYYASFFGLIGTVKYLEEQGVAELNAVGGQYGSALQAACFQGHLSIVTYLCSHDADINLRGGEYGTALNAAACMGHQKIVQHLLDFEADISITDSGGRTPIYLASREGHLIVVKLLLEKKADVNIAKSGGLTPLSSAAYNGRLEVVKYLFEKGANITITDDNEWTPLHVAAYYGHFEVVKYLFEKGADIMIANDNKWTPLNSAARNGHLEVVKSLFEKGADITIANSKGWTPLNSAADNGHLEVVKYLFEKGADITIANSNGWTPLNVAAYNDHLEVVKYLFENGANITTASSNGWTPLNAAAVNGHLEVVKFLIEKGADIKIANSNGCTPLNEAAYNDHLEVVKYLFENGADITTASSDGWTPLNAAAVNGHLEVVRYLFENGADITIASFKGWMPLNVVANYGHLEVADFLLGKGAEVNSKNIDSRTPLSLAAENGHEAVVKLLLENEYIELNPKDFNNDTPLSLASYNGHEAVIKLLLEKKGIEVNSKDMKIRTPLSLAAQNGHEAVVKLLLEKEDIEVNPKDLDNRTPLSLAAKNGHEAIVKLLLEIKNVELDSQDINYQTPLSLAAQFGHEAVVKLLFEKGADLSVEDVNGDTPLMLAAYYGHEAVVKCLLERGADPGAEDNEGQTPLSLAAQFGHEAVVKLLFEKGADLSVEDVNGDTPLMLAACYGHEAVVKCLLEKGADPGAEDNDGRTPLSLAAEEGHEAVVKLLLERGADPVAGDFYGRTPLSWAAHKGHEAVVKLLIEIEDVELDSKDINHQTPLSLAAEEGHEAVVKRLLEKGADPGAEDMYGQTPLSYAKKKGHEAIIKLLEEKRPNITSAPVSEPPTTSSTSASISDTPAT